MGSAVIILRAILILLVIFQDGLAKPLTRHCSNGVEVSKEVDYKLEDGKSVHTKRISFEGYGLVIGSFTEHTLGKVDDYFKCTALLEKTHYNGNHDLEVLKWSNGNRFELTSAKDRQPLTVAEHFVVIRQEVWNCQDINKKLSDIQRVVNEVISTSSVSEVKYYDGVLVERVNYESIDKYSAKVKDVKYITNNGKKWRLKGTLCLVKDGNSATFGIPNFQPHIGDEREREPIDNRIELSKSGESLKIGKLMSDEDKFPNNIRCTLTSEGSQYSPLFTTNLYYVEESNRQNPIKARISDKEFSKFFTIIKREVYSCTEYLKNWGFKHNYLRIVNEGIGMVPIKTLYYRKQDMDLKYIRVPGGNSVRFKDVMYINDNWKQGFFMSENVLIVEGHTASRRNSGGSIDIAYSLTPTTYYRTLIGSQGIDLRVGQFVSEPALEDSQSETVTCSSASRLYENKIDSFRTIVKAKIYDNGVISSMIVREKGGSNIYRSASTEILLCKNSKQDLKFLRIVNKVEVLVAVRDIETCDGIYIVPKILGDGQSMSVSITELKYLNETTFKPIKYGGTLEFEKQDLIQTTVDARRQALILSVEEAVRWNGQGVALDPYEIFRAYPSESERPDSLLPKHAGGDYKIVFNFKPTGELLSDLNIATCSITVPGTDEFLTPLYVETEFFTIKPTVMPVYETRFSLFFTLLLHEEWLCLGKNSPEKFMRIVNKYEMKPETPIPISHIDGFTSKLGDYYVEKRNGKMIPIITEVKYVMIDSRPTEFLNYRQYLLFPEQFREKKGVGMARSGTVVITKNRYSDILEGDKKEERVEGLSYQYRKAYQTKLSTKGVILEIGASLSKALKPFTQTRRSSCTPGGTLPRDYKIPIMVDGKSDTDGYLQMLDQEVWTCNRNGQNIGQSFDFFRVVSYAMILTQKITTIKELLYQDGVTVSWMHKDNIDSSYLSVMEVRYFDLKLQSIVRLSEDETLELRGDHKKEWEEVRKTRTKLVKRTNMEQILRSTIIADKGHYMIYIPIKFDDQVPHSPDAFVCKRINMILSQSNLLGGIQLYRYKSDVSFDMIAADSSCFKSYLRIKTFIQECKRNQETIYRVETLFDFNKASDGVCKIRAAIIHHHEGVTAVKSEGNIQIREIKFVDTLKNNKRKVLQFDGLIWVDDPDPENKEYNLLRQKDFRKDTDAYQLDSLPMMKFFTFNPPKKGIVLQIGSAWKDEVKVTEDMVICKQFFPQEKNEHYNIQVYSIKLFAVEKWYQFDSWQMDIFQGQTQDVWVCMRNDKEIFYRVVNYMVLRDEILGIYHTEGIHIGYLDLPDGSRNVEVRETKFIHLDYFHVLKYEGELQFVSEQQNLVERFFPLDYTATFPQPQFGYRELAGGGKYWTLGALAALAVRKQAFKSQSLAQITNPGIIDRMGFNGWSVASAEDKDGGGSRILHLGTQWQWNPDSDASTKGKQLKCMQHVWNQMYQTNHKYHPRVRELTRDNIHEFDREMFESVFKIVQQDIWICVWINDVNRDIFLLIATKFNLLNEMHAQFAVAFMHDGVGYDKNDNTFHETVLINTRNNKYSNYSGEIGFIPNDRKIQPGRDANIVTNANIETNANNNLFRGLFRKSKSKKKHNR